MEKIELKAKLREDLSKHHLKEIRRHGMIPGSFYGKGKPTLAIEVGLAGLASALKTDAGVHAMMSVKIEGAKRGEDGTAILKAIQKDPISRKLLHVEFERASAADKTTSMVTVNVVGDAPGIRDGGMLETVMDQIEVKSRVDQIPTHVDVDVSGLQLGDMIHAGDIPLPEGAELVSRAEDLVVALRMPHVRAGETAGEAAAETSTAAEPASEQG